MKNPIIAEIRQVREAYAERFNYDVYAMLRDLKEKQVRGEHKIVSLPPKRLKPVKHITQTTRTTST